MGQRISEARYVQDMHVDTWVYPEIQYQYAAHKFAYVVHVYIYPWWFNIWKILILEIILTSQVSARQASIRPIHLNYLY